MVPTGPWFVPWMACGGTRKKHSHVTALDGLPVEGINCLLTVSDHAAGRSRNKQCRALERHTPQNCPSTHRDSGNGARTGRFGLGRSDPASGFPVSIARLRDDQVVSVITIPRDCRATGFRAWPAPTTEPCGPELWTVA
jgi:hypothetical protein